MARSTRETGPHGEGITGPPWILGHRGAPRDAPENTLASLRLALELGLDGVEYDLHACASGEAVLLHDETLERTTNRRGSIRALTLPELAAVDAGSWFSARFAGEPLPILSEALVLGSEEPRRSPLHMIELKDPGLVAEVAREIRSLSRPLSIRIASFQRAVCLEARDLGLPSMLLATEASESDRRFVRDEGLAAYGAAPRGWHAAAGRREWSCERWSWSVDAPDDLIEACRTLFAFNTNEPRRAQAARALARLAPDDRGTWPIEAPLLEVPGELPRELRGRHGAWSGSWSVELGLRNPFAHPSSVALEVVVRGGVFEVAGLPARLRLAPGEAVRLPLRIVGGSWSPSEDPSVVARFVWRERPSASEQVLVLDAPLSRVRSLALAEGAQRLVMLAERPGDPEATMTLQRKGRELVAWVENPGQLKDVKALIRLGHETKNGSHGVRLALPETLLAGGDVPFCVGFEGTDAMGARHLRRFAGGLPYGLGSGAPGLLSVRARA